jgi:hypothetical protein
VPFVIAIFAMPPLLSILPLFSRHAAIIRQPFSAYAFFDDAAFHASLSPFSSSSIIEFR